MLMLLDALTKRVATIGDWTSKLDPLAFFITRETLQQTASNRLPSWFELDILRTCFENIDRFTARLSHLKEIPTMFLQKGSSYADHQDLREVRKDVGWRKNQFHAFTTYFHTDIVWASSLDTKRGGRLRLKPRAHFSCREDPWDKFPIVPLRGYRLVEELPKAMGVSNRTLTENIVRMIGHDCIHNLLPDVDTAHEPVHDVFSLWAMGLGEERSYLSLWDEVVSKEATDPLFYQYGSSLLEKVRKGDLTVHARKALAVFCEWHPVSGGPYHRDFLPQADGAPEEAARHALAHWAEQQERCGFPDYIYATP